jgi:hypothetical protein
MDSHMTTRIGVGSIKLHSFFHRGKRGPLRVVDPTTLTGGFVFGEATVQLYNHLCNMTLHMDMGV